MKVGIVGSRRREDKQSVLYLVGILKDDDIVVSGGCRGVDVWAEERANRRGLKIIIFKPKLKGLKNKGEIVNAYYERNKQIAQEADIVFAFVSKDRKGGTENTIKWARQLGKPVYIMEDIDNEAKSKSS